MPKSSLDYAELHGLQIAVTNCHCEVSKSWMLKRIKTLQEKT